MVGARDGVHRPSTSSSATAPARSTPRTPTATSARGPSPVSTPTPTTRSPSPRGSAALRHLRLRRRHDEPRLARPARRARPGHRPALDRTGGSLTATWTAAPGATDYEATLLPGGTVQAVSGTTATFPTVPGKEYTVTLAPHNANGWGPSRSASLDTSLPTVPGGLSVSGATTSAGLTWTPSTAPSPVTGYTVTATPSTGSPVTSAVPAAGLTFPVNGHRPRPATRRTRSASPRPTSSGRRAPPAGLKGTVTKATVHPGQAGLRPEGHRHRQGRGRRRPAAGGGPDDLALRPDQGDHAYTSVGARAITAPTARSRFTSRRRSAAGSS